MGLRRRYGDGALAAVRANPYLLAGENGVDFALADRIAMSMGMAADSGARVEAAVTFALSSWITPALMENSRNLMVRSSSLLGVIKSLLYAKPPSEMKSATRSRAKTFSA